MDIKTEKKGFVIEKRKSNLLSVEAGGEKHRHFDSDQEVNCLSKVVVEELYKKHSRFVFRFLYSRTQDETLAEELTQETFFQALLSIDRFEGKSLITTWLCRIALNVWSKHLKKENRLVYTPELLEDHFDWDMESDILKYLIVKEEKETLSSALREIPEKMRDVIKLRIVGEYSFREIGNIMGQSEGWARTMFYRGKQNLIKGVENHEA
jgi:RNA polymerase sigma-70 factor (ECF subfamily)